MEWISVEDRLPDKFCDVLIVNDVSKYYHPQQAIMWSYFNIHLEGNDRFTDADYDVTHWMPLPSPPKESV